MLKYYVINCNMQTGRMENYNIFNNWLLEEAVIKEIKRYLRLRNKYCSQRFGSEPIYGFDGFVDELRSLILWQEAGRCEYEIIVSPLFTNRRIGNGEEKWDCYRQCLPNIEMIAREVIYQYKQNLKKQDKKEAG